MQGKLDKHCFVKSTMIKAWTCTLFSHRKTTSISLCTTADSRGEQNRWDFISNLISICSLQIRAWVPYGLHAVRKNLLLIVTLLHYWDLVLHSVYDPAWEITEGALHYLSELTSQTIPVPMRISLLIKTIQSDLS